MQIKDWLEKKLNEARAEAEYNRGMGNTDRERYWRSMVQVCKDLERELRMLDGLTMAVITCAECRYGQRYVGYTGGDYYECYRPGMEGHRYAPDYYCAKAEVEPKEEQKHGEAGYQ